MKQAAAPLIFGLLLALAGIGLILLFGVAFTWVSVFIGVLLSRPSATNSGQPAGADPLFGEGIPFAIGPYMAGLILDNAALNVQSFNAILGEAGFIADASLVGLAFTDQPPDSLGELLHVSRPG